MLNKGPVHASNMEHLLVLRLNGGTTHAFNPQHLFVFRTLPLPRDDPEQNAGTIHTLMGGGRKGGIKGGGGQGGGGVWERGGVDQ